MFRFLATAVLFGGSALSAAEGWPTLHGDNGRSGWYDTFPAPPLKLAWHHDLSAELFSNHQGFTGQLNRRTGIITGLWGERDTYAGFYGPRIWGYENQGGPAKAAAAGKPYALINEWHGPARSILSIAGGRVYYHSGGQVLCLTSATADSPAPEK